LLKYPNCEICRRLREALPSEVDDEVINDYHESKGSYELFPKRHQDIVIEVMLSFREMDNDDVCGDMFEEHSTTTFE